MPQTRARTTVAISPELLEAVDRAVAEGLARSRNEFLAMALRNQLALCRRAAVHERQGRLGRARERRAAAVPAGSAGVSPAPARAAGLFGRPRSQPGSPILVGVVDVLTD